MAGTLLRQICVVTLLFLSHVLAKNGAAVNRCHPVIHHFQEDQTVLTITSAPWPLKQITLTQGEVQLRRERIIACACSNADSTSVDDTNSLRDQPSWLSVPASEQSSEWAFSKSWRGLAVQLKRVTYLTNFTSNQVYRCGYFGNAIQIGITIKPPIIASDFSSTSGSCKPEIYLASTGAPLTSRRIVAAHGRTFTDIRCRCLGSSSPDNMQLYWERNGVQLTKESGSTEILQELEGVVLSLNVTADSSVYRSTFKCRSGLIHSDSFILETLSGPVVTQILKTPQPMFVNEEVNITCVSAGWNPGSRLDFRLVRGGNESRTLAPRITSTVYETTKNVYVIEKSITFTPDWSMFQWNLQCQASNTDSAIWDLLVNGVKPGNADRFVEDERFQGVADSALTAYSTHPIEDVMALTIAEEESYTCEPSILFQDDTMEFNDRVIAVEEDKLFHLTCHCRNDTTQSSTGGIIRRPFSWTLRGEKLTSDSMAMAGTLAYRTYIASSKKDTQPTFVCHGRNASSASVTLNVLSPISQVNIALEQTDFVNTITNKITCSAPAANPPPLFRFVIHYQNGTVEEISSKDISFKSGLSETQFPPIMNSTASFVFLAEEQHAGAEIVCLAFQITDLLLLPPLPISTEHISQNSANTNTASVKVHLVKGRPPVITEFYSAPREPIVGELFKLFCLVESSAPLWNVRAIRQDGDGQNVSYPVVSNQHIMLREGGEMMEQIGAGLVATREHSGRYRCETRSVFGQAERVFHDVLVKAPPMLDASLLGFMGVRSVYVEKEQSHMELDVIVHDDTEHLNPIVLECWVGNGGNYYGHPLNDTSMERVPNKDTSESAIIRISMSSQDWRYGWSINGSRYLTCRATNSIGTSSPLNVQFKNPTIGMDVVRIDAILQRIAKSAVKQLRVSSRILMLLPNATSVVAFAQTVRSCSLVTGTEMLFNMTLNCSEQTTSGKLSRFHTTEYTFNISTTEPADAYRVTVVTQVGDELYHTSVMVNITQASNNYQNQHHHIKGMRNSTRIWMLALAIGAFCAFIVLVMAAARQSHKRSQNTFGKRSTISKHGTKFSDPSSVSKKDIFRQIEILENDPVVVRVSSNVRKSDHSFS
ncbi:hypothetical protein BV898_02735 [Hypsibius exemplaris]|uniref:Ig-like domain-containing protein n=1 Tax=Hypsibius exemplaris TaxID=2072580 RepID=A0A1W0X6X8_HYPEX|nr:hypothetical protein BV898_02735 [Hypsibius exemplaris]